MIIAKLQGGLGNQMFQYAYGLYLAKKHKTELKFDLSFLLNHSGVQKHPLRDFDLGIFGIKADLATPKELDMLKKRTGNKIINAILNKAFGKKSSYLIQQNNDFLPKYLNVKNDSYLEGYWQSEKFFIDISDTIKQKFTNINIDDPEILNLYNEISNCNAVCVNIRRGDFVTNSSHGTLPIEYFLTSEKVILDKIKNPFFYIFSDDIEWCLNNIRLKSQFKIIDHRFKGFKFSSYLKLMIACKHFIIPNSSFAWWAAYLSNNATDKMVCAPQTWANNQKLYSPDIYPTGWIKVKNRLV